MLLIILVVDIIVPNKTSKAPKRKLMFTISLKNKTTFMKPVRKKNHMELPNPFKSLYFNYKTPPQGRATFGYFSIKKVTTFYQTGVYFLIQTLPKSSAQYPPKLTKESMEPT